MDEKEVSQKVNHSVRRERPKSFEMPCKAFAKDESNRLEIKDDRLFA